MKVGNYNFEIKNLKHLESRSEETNCFSAALYVNGKKIADCGNSGHGGPTDVNFLPQYWEMKTEIDHFLATQLKIKYKNFEFDRTMEFIVNELVEDLLKAKALQNLLKKTGKYLIFRNPQGTYYQIGWRKYRVDELFNIQSGRDMLQNTIASHIAKGNILINKNIPSELLP